MGNHTKPNKEKKKPLISFVIRFPMNFSISTTPSTFNKFKSTFEHGHDNPNNFFVRKLLSIFEVENVDELLKKYPDLRYSFKKFKGKLKREAGLETDFSKWIQEEMQKRVDEYDKNKGK